MLVHTIASPSIAQHRIQTSKNGGCQPDLYVSQQPPNTYGGQVLGGRIFNTVCTYGRVFECTGSPNKDLWEAIISRKKIKYRIDSGVPKTALDRDLTSISSIATTIKETNGHRSEFSWMSDIIFFSANKRSWRGSPTTAETTSHDGAGILPRRLQTS